MKVQAAYLFWSGSNRSPISIAIRSVTGPGRFSHTGLIFVRGDEDGNYGRDTREIHEAHIKTGYSAKPQSWLREWASRRGNYYEAKRLTLEPHQLERLYADSLEAMTRYEDASGYDGRQLFRLLLWDAALDKLGFSISDDPRAVVCSEITTRLCRAVGIDLRETDDETPDEATPNSTYRAFVRRYGNPPA